jgi:hypothetical protein
MKLPRGVSADPRTSRPGIREDPPKGQSSHFAAFGSADPHNHRPLHNPLKTGTLHGILSEVARMRSITIDSIAELL